MKLSILIPSLENRAHLLRRLLINLESQTTDNVEIILDVDKGIKKIGEKRNDLIARAKGEYIVFIDDDDNVPSYYIDEILKALKTNPDCVGLKGILTYTNNPNRVETFLHYLGSNYYTDGITHYRYPNHLNPMKRELVKDIKFKEINMGEDYDWATQIMKLNLLKSSYEIPRDKVMYYYMYNPKK